MTVEELLDRMSSREITEWRVFFEMQEEEVNRQNRKHQAQANRRSEKPTLGGAAASDAITEARRAQGLEP